MTREDFGKNIYDLIKVLYPINRSLTGAGVLETFDSIQKHIPLVVRSVNSGASVFDWTIPQEWNIRDAWIKNSKGEKIIDFKKNNLHIVGYSAPFTGNLSLNELKKHLYSLPNHPDWIPYRTSYYKKDWGFCLTDKVLQKLPEDTYDVCIDSELKKGSLKYAELVIPGESKKEVLISSHICHPSLANDNLSAVAVSVFLAKYLLNKKNRYTYRFIFAPGTIGAIAWAYQNRKSLSNVLGAIILAGIGDGGTLTYKKSLTGLSCVDTIFKKVLTDSKKKHDIREYIPYGYDERQYNSLGIGIPAVCFMRTPWGKYPEYHTSADNLEFISKKSLEESYDILKDVLAEFDTEVFYKNVHSAGEPMLSKHGYYDCVPESLKMESLWLLALSDGRTPLSMISKRSKLDIKKIEKSAEMLEKLNLLIKC